MKSGTKCRLKYMPTTTVIVHSMVNDFVAEVYHILYKDAVKSDHIFPVPLSELEEIKEWPKSISELGYVTSLSLCDTPATKIQHESMKAFAQLSQLHKAIVGDWVPDWEDLYQTAYVIKRLKKILVIEEYCINVNHLAFQTKEQAEFSLKHHRELWEKYWML